jgi:hypothetical protein
MMHAVRDILYVKYAWMTLKIQRIKNAQYAAIKSIKELIDSL